MFQLESMLGVRRVVPVKMTLAVPTLPAGDGRTGLYGLVGGVPPTQLAPVLQLSFAPPPFQVCAWVAVEMARMLTMMRHGEDTRGPSASLGVCLFLEKGKAMKYTANVTSVTLPVYCDGITVRQPRGCGELHLNQCGSIVLSS